MGKVLVTDCWTRKALAAVRALGSEGLDVFCISHTKLSPSIYSRYSKKYYRFPLPQNNPDEYKNCLLELISKEKFDCIIPLEEPTIEIIYSSLSEIEKYTNISLPSRESYIKANDKWESVQFAKSLNIPAPVSSIMPGDVEKIGFPLIIKPRNSSGSRGLKKINNRQEFDKYYPIIKSKYGTPVIQECLPAEGQGLGVACIAENGNTKVSFSYKRLREFPVNGGPGTLNESTDDNIIKQYAEKLLKELKWSGVAMIEFKINTKTGEATFIEINPRYWGSLHLSIVSGINFPYLNYLQAIKQPLEKQEYKTGIKSRWLIPGDILHFIMNPKRLELKPSFFSFFSKDTYYAQYDNKDIKGNIAVILCNILMVFSISRWKKGIIRK